MAIIVQKFGGTSVGSLERIELVAEKIINTKQQGHQVVAVLSAMSGETNRLIDMATQLDSQPSPRELDMLLATGEQVSIALLAIALIKRGYSAVSLLGHQLGIHTNNRFGNARILSVDNKRLTSELAQGHIVIAAGFQGVDEEGNITTLGRGGSDLSAIALAAVINAAECQIYTDVLGVYTTDPRIVPNARLLPTINFNEMVEFASLGAKVLQGRAVEFAGLYNVPLRVLSSFASGEGTLINYSIDSSAKNPVTGIAVQSEQIMVEIDGIKQGQQFLVELFTVLGENDINVDMINQASNNKGDMRLSFVAHRAYFSQITQILANLEKKYVVGSIHWLHNLAKISAVGNGLKSHAGVAGVIFSTLLSQNITIRLISTSEIKISVIVEVDFLELAVRSLHSAFKLEQIS